MMELNPRRHGGVGELNNGDTRLSESERDHAEKQYSDSYGGPRSNTFR